MIKKIKPSVSFFGVDMQANVPALIERKVYDGMKLPFPDKSFDVVMALDALHHAEDAPALLKEIKRVTKQRIIIKGHSKHGFVSNIMISVYDYFSNVPYEIKRRFSYYSMKEWEELFDGLQLRVVAVPRISGFLATPRYNPLFKLEKLEQKG